MLGKILKFSPVRAFVIVPFFILALPFGPFVPSIIKVTRAPVPLEIITNGSIALGEVASFSIKLPPKAYTKTGSFNGTPVFFFKSGSGYSALLPATLSSTLGTHLLELKIEAPGKESKSFFYPLEIKDKKYEVSRITVPKSMSHFSKKTLKRMKKERKSVKKALSKGTGKKLWKDAFIRPVPGKLTSGFGKRRFINGESRNPHSGADFRTPLGEPVLSPSSGVVALIGNHYLTGYTVIIDHGLELFSFYYHLSKLEVKTGEVVEEGTLLGLAGSTGRSTGPHLHWGIKIGGIKVNPLSLITATEEITFIRESEG